MKPLNRILGMSLVLLFWSVLGAYGAVITEVPETISLDDGENALWARVENINDGDTITVAVTKPDGTNFFLSDDEQTETNEGTYTIFEWPLDTDAFTEAGKYNVVYYINDVEVEGIGSTIEKLIRLISPGVPKDDDIPTISADLSEIPLRWGPYENPNATYTLKLEVIEYDYANNSGDNGTLVLSTDVAGNSYTIMASDNIIYAGYDYEWYIEAFDDDGNFIAQSTSFWFYCNNGTGISGSLIGTVNVENPDFTITIRKGSDDPNPLVLDQGRILIFTDGTFSIGIEDDHCGENLEITISQKGYQSQKFENQTIPEGGSLQLPDPITLVPEKDIVGDINLSGGVDHDDLVLIFKIFAGFSPGLETYGDTDINSSGGFTFADVAALYDILPPDEK